MNIGIIPARGGSKGIPKKNIVDFQGEPLIGHTIRHAEEAERIDAVYVSTDDDEIASVAREYGAQIIERPDEIAGDEASTESALHHALDVLEGQGQRPDLMVLLQCTSPLRRDGDIDATIALVEDEDYDSALSACEDHSFYWKETKDGGEPINYDPRDRKRRQDLDELWYRENGSIYVYPPEILEKHDSRLGGKIGIHEMPELYSFEIDTPQDLKLLKSIAETSMDSNDD